MDSYIIWFFKAFVIVMVSIWLLYLTNNIIQKILKNTSLKKESEQVKNGRKIGFYERILYFIGILTQNWVLVSIVIALKTVARYKEIDKQINAEYFLMGSMLSLIFSIIIAGIFIFLDNIFNTEILNYIHDLIVFNLKVVDDIKIIN